MRDVKPEEIHRLFYPVIPSVVASRHSGRVGALLAIPSTLSFNPPMVGVSLNPRTSTYGLVDKSGMFSICLVSYQHADKLARLAEHVPEVEDKLVWAGFQHVAGKVLPVPVLAEAIAVMECSVAWSRMVGDHTLFVAEVRAAYADEDFEGYWHFNRYRPVFYVGKSRRYGESYVSLDLR
ncbi:Flavoredoxin [archaeon HR01]|nr:Flavoredoxin [archaeon HR01]